MCPHCNAAHQGWHSRLALELRMKSSAALGRGAKPRVRRPFTVLTAPRAEFKNEPVVNVSKMNLLLMFQK